MSKRKGLSDFEGKDVLRSTIAITNAGDGLSDSMKVEPREFHQGDREYVVLECEVAKVTFQPVDKDDPGGPQQRVHSFRAGTATIVDAALVKDLIEAQAAKNLAAAEAEAGIQQLPLGSDAPDPMVQRVRNWLSSQTKAVLRGLCDEFDIAYSAKATAPDLIDLLAENADKIKDLVGEDA